MSKRPAKPASTRPAPTRPDAVAAPPAPDAGNLPDGPFPLRQVVAVVAAAVAMRLAYFLIYRDSPFYHVPVVDASTFNLWAKTIVAGQQFQPDVFFKPPLYPYLLSVCYRIFGPQVAPVYLIQAALGVATSLLVLGCGRLVFTARVALTGALVYALLPLPPFFEFQLLAESLTTFLTVLALLLVLVGVYRPGGKSGWYLLSAGVVLGIAALGRPNLMILPPVWAVWLFVTARRSGSEHTAPANAGGRPWRPALLLLLGAVVAIAPVTLRNARVGGSFVPVSANLGVNLWAGIRPGADGVSPVQIGVAWDDLQLQCGAAGAKGAAASSRYLVRQSLRQAGADPLRTVGLGLKKTVVLVGAYEGRNNIGAAFLAREQGLFLLGRWWPSFWLIGPFALLGIAAALWPRLLDSRRASAQAPLLLYLAALAVVVVPFFVNARFRMPLLPVLALYAGYGFWSLATQLRSSGVRGSAAALAVLCAAFVTINVDWFGLNEQVTTARDEMNLAVILAQGYDDHPPDPAGAERHFVRAQQIDPSDADIVDRRGLLILTQAIPLIEQAETAERLGNGEEMLRFDGAAEPLLEAAATHHQQAVRLYPRSFRSYTSLGDCHLWLGQAAARRTDLALAAADSALAREAALTALDRFENAGVAYDRALRVKADYSWARTNIALCRDGILALPPLDAAITTSQARFTGRN